MLSPIIVLFLTIFTGAVQSQAETKVINLNQGPVRGYKHSKLDIFTFQGIPYAEEPKGKDKFKAPLPAPSWPGTLNANTTYKCPQTILSQFHPIPDNCLICSIYVPSTNVVNLPVLIFIHGGGFAGGSEDDQKPETLVNSQRIVAVSINYRLGVHGFLCLGTEGAPGNAGMKDQVAAIRWVKENIAKFGGNPNDITIAGSSAGSASVNLHQLSKMSNGLFQKIIADSAADIAPFAMIQDPINESKKFVRRISSTVNVDDLQELEDFYLQTPVDELIKQELIINEDYTLTFGPCVEKNLGAETFLEASAYSIIKSGDFPKLPKYEGFANMEGLLRIAEFDEYYPKMNEDFSAFLPGDLQFESKEQKNEVARTVKQFYFGDKDVGPDTALEFFEYFSDTGFTYSILRSIKLHLEAGMDTYYLFEYAFVDENTGYIPHTNVKGALHSAQTIAIFDLPLLELFFPETPEMTKMRTTLREFYLNFITHGRPVLEDTVSVPAWPKVQKFNSPYMLLNQTSTLESSLLQRKFDFWDKIYEKHYHEPQPPNNRGLYYQYSLVLTLISCVFYSILS